MKRACIFFLCIFWGVSGASAKAGDLPALVNDDQKSIISNSQGSGLEPELTASQRLERMKIPKGSPKYNMSEDPRFHSNGNKGYEEDADTRFGIKANPYSNMSGDPHYNLGLEPMATPPDFSSGGQK